MGIGYLLLDAALAVVALWLTAELLLQNRAPLAWRGVALGGFLCVVAGMALGSVPVIGLGAAAFAVGQVFVTLSVKRGYVAGWSLRRSDGSLPGPLARVPLLAAATGGTAVAAAVAVEPVGEVGPIESEAPAEPFAEMQELTPDGVYAEEPAAYYQPQPDQYYQSGYQQPAYADQQWQQQQAQPQAWQYQPQYQDPYAQPQYQDPYGQPQYQDPYGQPQPTWQQHQQPYIPEQPAYSHQPQAQQPWDYQQQG